jgi:hypothetical protein
MTQWDNPVVLSNYTANLVPLIGGKLLARADTPQLLFFARKDTSISLYIYCICCNLKYCTMTRMLKYESDV